MQPLLQEFGFSRAGSGERIVEFISPYLRCRVFQGRRSDVIGIELLRDSEIVNLVDLLSDVGESGPGMAVRTRAAIRNRLTWLRDFMSLNYIALLQGDSSAFERVKRSGASHNAEYNYALLIEPTLTKASEAFREKRFEDVIALLEPIEEQLRPVDRKKLEFARGKLS